MSALPKPSPSRRLTDTERAELLRRESRIRRNMKATCDTVEDLAYIGEKKLYREKYESFDLYLSEVWLINRGQGYRLINRARVTAAIAEPGDDLPETIPLPTTERQTRELKGLPAPIQRAAWKEAVEKSGPAPTGPEVAAAVARVAPKPKKDSVEWAKAKGIIPEGATVEVFEPDADSADEPAPGPPPELGDADYLASCPAREKLPPHVRANFDAEALAFRAATPARLHYGRVVKPITNAAKRACKGHIGPWMAKHFRYLTTNGPERWVACSPCEGTGQVPLIGQCAACHGHGYHL